MKRRYHLVGLVALLWLLVLVPVSAMQPPRPGHGGAPPRGRGPVDITGFVRVIDGDTFETWIDGKRVGVGILGIDAPQGNTPCGREATALLRTLVPAGLRLEDDDDPAFDFDTDHRKRRNYNISSLGGVGELIPEILVRAGVVRASGKGKHRQRLEAAEQEARAARRGCLWSTGALGNAAGPTGSTAVTLLSVPPAPRSPAGGRVAALALPTDFTHDVVATGANNPTAFSFLPDGRILIAEKGGIVRLHKNGALLSTPFIDLRDRVNDYWDHGLLGIAAAPNFAQNGHVYLLYTYENDAAQYNGPKTARLTRVTAAGDTAAPASEVAILGKTVGSTCNAFSAGTDCLPSESPSHSVGNIKFAPDGTMFVTTGDASSFNVVDDDALRSQNLDLLAGKLLHITTGGAGVVGNPFWNSSTPNANRSKVWAYGLRNPYRFGLRPGSNVPYVGDVGWGEWEEVNVAPAGANFGWPCYEGIGRQGGYEPKATCQALYNQGPGAARPPTITWDHASPVDGSYLSSAATGGAFYTGTTYPAQYQGAYFYGDYSQSFIRYARVDASNNLVGNPSDFATAADGPVDIQMGPDGNLHYLAINTGELRRIRYTAPGGSPPPGGNLALNKAATGSAPCAASEGAPKAVDGTVAGNSKWCSLVAGTKTWQVDLGSSASVARVVVKHAAAGGELAALNTRDFTVQVSPNGTAWTTVATVTGNTANETTHTFAATPAQHVRLTITTPTSNGDAAARIYEVEVYASSGSPPPNQPPVATIATPSSSLTYKVGDVINYSGSASDPEAGAVPATSLAWEIIIHHCPGGACHNHPFLDSTGATGSFMVPDHGDESYFELKLTATDSGGQTGSASVNVQPQTVQLTLNTAPTGLEVVYGGTTYTTPQTLTTVVGSKHTITAPSPQTLNGTTYIFGSWSDGGAQQHDITVGATNMTRTATFTVANPVPTTTSLSPNSATAGGAGFTLIVTGTGFVNGASVRWNGTGRPTTFVSATQLTAAIPATDIAAAGTASVTVVNPTPGGGTSNPQTFTITATTPPPTPTPTPGPAPANLALNKAATADSACGAAEAAARAVDGMVTGNSKWCSLGATKWWQVDLGAATTVGRFVIKHAGSGGEDSGWNTRDFTIQVSTNGTSWTTVATVTGNTLSETSHTIAATSARYVRLNITVATSTTTNVAARIYEVEVYGPSTGSQANLALGKTATASSACATTEGAANAVDGTIAGNSKWCSLGATKWWQVDLGAATNVSRFVVKHAGSGGELAAWNTRDFTIQVSTDGTNWVTVVTVTGNTASETTHTITARQARYVRLNITTPTSDGNTAARIYEIEVYGP